MTAARDARGRRIWPWPLAVAVLAVLRDVLVVGWGAEGLQGAGTLAVAVGLVIVAGVAALVWLWARRAGTYYGTAVATGVAFALLPGHAGWVERRGAGWLEGLVTALLVAGAYCGMGRWTGSAGWANTGGRQAESGHGRKTVAVAVGMLGLSATSWGIVGRAVPPLSLGVALMAGHVLAGAVRGGWSRRDAESSG